MQTENKRPVPENRATTPYRERLYRERGQTTVALAGVLALACMIGLGLALVGQTMVHRAEARNAADAVALASSLDAAAADELSARYWAKGMSVEHGDGHALVGSGPSQAAAWAAATQSSSSGAPVMVAIVRRAEQLVGAKFTSVQWDELSLRLDPDHASALRTVAASFSLCELSRPGPQDQITFALC